MTWNGLAKGLLFCAAMASSLTAGNLFYFERYAPGGALFALTALFLFFAMAAPRGVSSTSDNEDDNFPESGAELRKTVSDLALMVAENALDGAKRIGRTLPCSPTELSKLEEDLMSLLSDLNVDRKHRERIANEIDKLRTRARQNEGRRALTSNRF